MSFNKCDLDPNNLATDDEDDEANHMGQNGEHSSQVGEILHMRL